MVPLVLEEGRWLHRYEQTDSSPLPFPDEDSPASSLYTYSLNSGTVTPLPPVDRSTWGARRDPLYIVIPVTIVYAVIFLTGVVGNVSTCVVIARNKSMHTATNYYLFSLAVSDLLLLVSGLPPEMYYIWSHFPYVFGEVFCVIQGFAAETSANATVLTITAFTIERYVAICHPFLSHTMSKLTRAVKFVVAIWLVALCLAVPQAMSVGIVYETLKDGRIPYEDHYVCVVKRVVIPHAFEISTVVFFVAPMTLITVLYVLIGLQLRRSSVIARGGAAGSSVSLKTRGIFKRKERASTEVVAVMLPDGHQAQTNENAAHPHMDDGRKNYSKNVQNKATKHVVKMLVAVVVAFFICWAPFHAQRLLAVYGTNNAPHMVAVFNVLTYVSGILYYLSTTINPLLYHIMSNKFREAFKDTLARCCGRGRLARRRAAAGGVGAQGGVGRCYSILSGRFSQNNSTSGGSNGLEYCGVLSKEEGRSLHLQGEDSEVTTLREFRRPLVVSFRRRHGAVASRSGDPRVREDRLDNELQEALASLAADENKSRYPIFPRSRRSADIAPPNAAGNNLSLHVVCRESTALGGEEIAEAAVLLESGIEVEPTRFFEDIEDRRRRISPRGRRAQDAIARVEDIEIFQEQRLVMRDFIRNAARPNHSDGTFNTTDRFSENEENYGSEIRAQESTNSSS